MFQIPGVEFISHAFIFWFMASCMLVLAGLIAYLYKRIDSMKQEISATVPTKKEVDQIAQSLRDIAARLDSLYMLLAQRAIDDIPKG